MTFGTFDLFHIGHLHILKRARALGDELVVGVSSDELNFQKKKAYPIYPTKHRLDIVQAIEYVNSVFVEESLENKREYLVKHKADCLVMGDDWTGRFDEFSDVCEVIYLPRTPVISSSEIRLVCQYDRSELKTTWDAL